MRCITVRIKPDKMSDRDLMKFTVDWDVLHFLLGPDIMACGLDIDMNKVYRRA